MNQQIIHETLVFSMTILCLKFLYLPKQATLTAKSKRSPSGLFVELFVNVFICFLKSLKLLTK